MLNGLNVWKLLPIYSLIVALFNGCFRKTLCFPYYLTGDMVNNAMPINSIYYS